MRPLWPETIEPGVPLDEPGRLWYLLLAGMVQRYHSVPTVTTDTVGEHTFGVAWLCVILWGGLPRAELLLAAVMHDVPELTLGDMPAPAKRILGIREQLKKMENDILTGTLGIPVSKLTENEQRVLSLADVSDGMLHCCYERALGNRVIEEVYERFLSYTEQLNPNPNERGIIEAIEHIWESYHHA